VSRFVQHHLEPQQPRLLSLPETGMRLRETGIRRTRSGRRRIWSNWRRAGGRTSTAIRRNIKVP